MTLLAGHLHAKIFQNHSKVRPHFQPKFFNKTFQENHKWDVSILSAPKCPEESVIRLVTTSLFNFELRNLIRSHIRNQNRKYSKTFFLIGRIEGRDHRTTQSQLKYINDLSVNPLLKEMMLR